MRYLSWPQGIVLLVGLVIVLVCLILPFSAFNVWYYWEEVIGGGYNYVAVTCPAPVDQPSCDGIAGDVAAAICETCSDHASTKMTWFWTLFGLTIVGTAAGYVIAGRETAKKASG